MSRRTALISSLLAMASSGALAQQDLPSTDDQNTPYDWSVTLSGGTSHSRWREDLSSVPLQVNERGYFPTLALMIAKHSNHGVASFSIQNSRGSRIYEGWSNTGTAIISDSDIESTTMQAQYMWHMTTGWAWGLRGQKETMRRQIQSVAQAQGYLETYNSLSVLLGASKTWYLPAGASLALSGWIGGGRGPLMTLNLEPFDPATVRLGSAKQIEMSATWRSSISGRGASSWHWVGQLMYDQYRSDPSARAFLQSQGVTAASFTQPSTKRAKWSAMLGLEHRW